MPVLHKGPKVVRPPVRTPPRGPIVLDRPRAPVLSCAGSMTGSYRIEDSAYDGYLLYRGVDAQPDLAGAAWQSFASLPYTTPELDPEHTYFFVLRRRNKWGLISQNLSSWSVTIDAAGDEEPLPPHGPSDVTVEPAAAGTIQVTARYNGGADGIYQADTWLIYVTTGGADPDPEIDTPVEVAMVQVESVMRLSYTTAAYSEGTIVKVLVRTRRSGTPDSDSVNSTIYTATATLIGPDAPLTHLFLGDQAEQLNAVMELRSVVITGPGVAEFTWSKNLPDPGGDYSWFTMLDGISPVTIEGVTSIAANVWTVAFGSGFSGAPWFVDFPLFLAATGVEYTGNDSGFTE